MNNDVIKLRDWLLSHNCRYACMESTGKYWIPIWNILEKKISLTLAHPKYTKAIKGKKTDKKDSKWIADLFKHDLVPNSFIPPADIRQLRDLSKYRYKLTYIKFLKKIEFKIVLLCLIFVLILLFLTLLVNLLDLL